VAVGIYLRVSTEEQRERQFHRHAGEFGSATPSCTSCTIYELFADDGVSGTVSFESRPEGKRVLEAAPPRQFDSCSSSSSIVWREHA